MKKKKKKTGRPEKIDAATLQKLEDAFAYGCTDEEACIYADIKIRTLYHYQKRHPEFLHRKALLKMKPVLFARKSVVEGVKKSPTLAMTFLERKLPKEFGETIKQEVDLTARVSYSAEARKRIQKYVDPTTQQPESKNSKKG